MRHRPTKAPSDPHHSTRKRHPMNENGYGKAILDELRPLHRELRHAIPDVYKGFAEFHRAAFAPGVLTTDQGAHCVVHRRDPALRRMHRLTCRGRGPAGATPQEAAEAIGVAMLYERRSSHDLRPTRLCRLLRVRRRQGGVTGSRADVWNDTPRGYTRISRTRPLQEHVLRCSFASTTWSACRTPAT